MRRAVGKKLGLALFAALFSLACERNYLVAPEGGPAFADPKRNQADPSLYVLHPDGYDTKIFALIGDARPRWQYDRAHAPAAYAVPADELVDLFGRGEPARVYKELKERVAEQFHVRTGIPLIVYDDPIAGHGEAALVVYLLREKIGLENVVYLDGGRYASTGSAVTKEVPPPLGPKWDEAELSPGAVGPSAEEIHEMIQAPDTVLLDVRSPDEFSGEQPRSPTRQLLQLWKFLGSMKERGRIAGAKNFYWRKLLTRSGYLRSREDIRSILAEIGATPEKRVIVYDAWMYRSSFVWMVLKDLGYENVVNFEGGLIEWVHKARFPLESDVVENSAG